MCIRDRFWLENLNLRGGFKKTITDYIAGQYPDLIPLYQEIYNKPNRSYFEALEVKAEKMAKKYDCAFVAVSYTHLAILTLQYISLHWKDK